MYIKEQRYRRDFVFLCRPVHGVTIKKNITKWEGHYYLKSHSSND